MNCAEAIIFPGSSTEPDFHGRCESYRSEHDYRFFGRVSPLEGI
ncbi:MAG: hypothetical protein ABRQ39_26530 [Candidatus Eremiobacterota bacterium]